ncbi:beta-Ala-His dipeptidase-like [Scleropages formosus]|uniref:beta-Ala-His dipeptidase-like n=1 Tax=Scleropages formosus TaxID=113540 RepID=UPI0010FAA137|nr:beta-Ala-His dipeptidase-like [Scleropages formosus]
MGTKLLAVAVMLFQVASCSESSAVLEPLFRHIDQRQNDFVQRLREWVAIPSDSSQPSLWGEVERMLHVAADKITAMGGTVEFADVGSHELPSGASLRRPPVILAQFEKEPKKATLCFYGHVDVQPANKEDGWATEPFNLTEIDGNLYGRGASDNKGPVLAWLHAIETYLATKQEVPVNIKLVLEGLEESGSDGLEELIQQRNDTFFSDVDYIVISDNVWLSRRPALTYGTRGSTYFFVEVEGPKIDLHSGVFGGCVQEPVGDLIALLGSLLDHRGKILVPGIYESVAPVTEEESKSYQDLHFDLEEMKQEIGVECFLQDTKEAMLMARWRYPSLSIHGIEGAFSQPGSKTVIPRRVVGKFSIRQVPNMEPAVVEKQVTEHLHRVFTRRRSPNKLKVSATVGAKAWVADLKDPQYIAGRRAVKAVFGGEPELIREGSTIPVAHNFQELTGKSVMMLPIGGHDDAEHSEKEKISRYNFIEGTKLFAAYFYELSQLQQSPQKM